MIGSRPWHSGGRDPGAEGAGGHDGGVRNRMRSVTRRMIATGYAVRHIHIKERKGSERVSGNTGNCCDSRGKF